MGKHRRLVITLSFLCVGMLALSFASVPLYQLFCQVTGFGGTTQVSAELPSAQKIHTIEGGRSFQIRFDANIAKDLDWDFYPGELEITLELGEAGKTHYVVRNRSAEPLVGSATFNVTPLKGGSYFSKVQCFCFNEQRLEPYETKKLPVVFYVNPTIMEDHGMDEVKTFTLSYTFHRVTGESDETQDQEHADQHARADH